MEKEVWEHFLGFHFAKRLLRQWTQACYFHMAKMKEAAQNGLELSLQKPPKQPNLLKLVNIPLLVALDQHTASPTSVSTMESSPNLSLWYLTPLHTSKDKSIWVLFFEVIHLWAESTSQSSKCKAKVLKNQDYDNCNQNEDALHCWMEWISTFSEWLICGQGAATARPPAEEASTQFSAKIQITKLPNTKM